MSIRGTICAATTTTTTTTIDNSTHREINSFYEHINCTDNRPQNVTDTHNKSKSF